MKTIRFNNLIDTNTGKIAEIKVPDTFDEYSDSLAKARLRGKLFGKRFARIARKNIAG